MSHFTVLILHDADEDIERILEPYSEHREVAPYKSHERGTPETFWATKMLREEGLLPSDGDVTWEQVAKAYGDKYPEAKSEYEVDAEGMYSWSTYSPDSKWDWWVVGGRWGNYFRVKPGFEQDPRLTIGDQPAIGGFVPEPGRCDGGPKGLLDIEAMRNEKGDAAGQTWDIVHGILRHHPKIKHWSEFLKDVDADAITLDEARKLYREQSGVYALQASKLIGFFGPGAEEFDVPRATFVHRARAAAVPGFAAIYKGRWMAPGDMGWWGMSTETQSTQDQYWEQVNRLIDEASDETYLTVVDCHI